jgi:hypothetical protein
MTQQPAPNDRQKVLKGDFLFACSMLIACCVFVTSLIALPLWEFEQSQQIISANSTATAFAFATQRANATATIIAQATEQAQYKYIDPFNDNTENWLTEFSDDEYMNGSLAINGGIYAWNIQEVKQPFIYWSNFHQGSRFEDFDVYVDSKITAGAPGDACSGFVFRTASFDWEEGAYLFSVCNDSYFDVDYYEQGEWDVIADWTYSAAIRNDDWNRLEIRARGTHFTFLINHEVVYEMTDDRQPTGGLALMIDINETNPVSIWFDNFGLQPR